MYNEQKERLEQELRFLKESLEADVISKDEYEKGKERIEKKLEELAQSKEEKPEEKKEEEIKSEEPSETEEEKREIKEEPKIEIKEIKEKPTKIIGAEEEKPEEPEEEIRETEEPKKEEKEPITEKKEPEEEPEEEIKISKKWLYGIAIIIVAIILFFAIRSCKSPEESLIEEFTPECSSDSDCKQEGMIGTCLNPGTEEAKCDFKEDIRTNLIVVNDKNCKLCDSSTTKTIVKEIFPNVNIREIDYETEEAKKLINDFNINALPAYIFDSNVTKAINFNDFKTALVKEGDSYIITNTASGAAYYFKRPLIKNKLDLYLLPETNEKIESSVQEVLDLFKDKINFTKHVVTERQKELLEKELAINTYPSFLLNNQLKFRGILPANTIKERICQVDYFEECEKELSNI